MINVFPRSVVVWDFETTGFSPQDDRVVEVGAAIVREGLVVEQWSSLIKINCEIPQAAQEVHGISKEMCEKEGIPAIYSIKRLLQNIRDCEAHVTHNGSRFDLLFLEEEIKRDPVPMDAATILQSWHEIVEKHIDTAALYKAHKMGLQKRWNEPWHDFFVRTLERPVKGLKYSLGACCDDLGISRESVEQHRALGDVTLTHKIYEKLVS